MAQDVFRVNQATPPTVLHHAPDWSSAFLEGNLVVTWKNKNRPRFWPNSIRPCESIGDASNKMIPLFFQLLPSMRVVRSGGVVMVSQHSQKSGKYSRFGGREMGEIWPEIIEAKNGQC